jgi:hypothetical protein
MSYFDPTTHTSENPDTSPAPQTPNGEVRIGKYLFSVLGGNVNELNLARFQGKTTFGDYSFDSDPLLSSQIFSSFTGGQGNEEVKAGVEDDTFWTATLETRFPSGPTLLPLSEPYGSEIAASNALPIADFPATNPSFYCAFDDDLYKWDDTTSEFDLVDTLPATPVERGIIFEGLLYIPLGGTGYVTMDGSEVITPETDVEPIHFILWDRKLVALDVDGALWIKPRGLGWVTPTDDLTLPDGSKPRKLAKFIDQKGNPTVYIVSDTMMYTYDPDQEVLHDTHLDYPKHPNQGLGATNWRGESLYVSFGTGIRSYNGSITASMGPDRRYGLPAHLRGTIVDLYPEYNALLAMVQGEGVVSDTLIEDEFRIHPPLYRDYWSEIGDYQSSMPVYSSIMRWSNSQWHKVWESTEATGFPTFMYVSEADSNYRLWWGYAGQMYVQDLPIADQNPKQALKSGAMRFMPDGKLITGWFDADMVAFRKLSSHIEIVLEDVIDANESGGTVRVRYQTEREPDFVLLGEATLAGRTILPFGLIPRQVGEPFSTGKPFRRIRWEFEFLQKSGEPFLSPLMSSAVHKFIKIPESQLSWSFNVDLIASERFKQESNETLRAYLDSLLTSEAFFEFVIGDETYRGRMAQAQGDRTTGQDDRTTIQVNIVEAVIPPSVYQ